MRIQLLLKNKSLVVMVDGKKVSSHKTIEAAQKKIYQIKTGKLK